MGNELFIIYEAGLLKIDEEKIAYLLNEYLKTLGDNYLKSGRITENISCFYLTPKGNRFGHKGASCAFNYDKNSFKNITYLNNCNLEDVDSIINNYYQRYGIRYFEKLGKYLNFSSVIFDIYNKDFIAGVVNGKKAGIKLFKGISKNNKYIYSNCKEILNEVCSIVIEISDNSYTVGDEIFYIKSNENEYTRKLWHKLEEYVENID